MNFILVLSVSLFAIGISCAASHHVSSELRKEWENYKKKFGKTYPDPNEDKRRMKIYVENKKIIQIHNKKFEEGKVDYEMGINQFSDMEPHELTGGLLRSKLNSNHQVLRPSRRRRKPKKSKNVDWVKKGAVNKIKNEISCDASYAFAAVSALEGRHFIKKKKLLDLSEQNIVDCSIQYGNDGCYGGTIERAYNYIIENEGINNQYVYPYKGRKITCSFKNGEIAAKMSGYKVIQTEEELKKAVAEGPVAAEIDGRPSSFRVYSGGVYSNRECGTNGLNHAVTIVGYGTDNTTNEDYWLIRNSWGRAWGEQGYMRLLRGINLCNIGSHVVVPVI